jgi:glutamate-5-semialdehyde dehydrogenase
MTDLIQMGQAARAASRQLAIALTAQKNAALLAIADELMHAAPAILEQNARDMTDAGTRGLSDALLDRLLLNDKRLAALATDTRHVAELPDPVGADIEGRLLPNGLRLTKRRTPIGVIGVIYEARPNVTIDVAVLCLKTGNAAILRGGSETLRSNLALVQAVSAGLNRAGLPTTAIQYIDDPDRGLVAQLLRLDQYVDMIIPRGGASLHRLCREQASVPVITGGMGICHIYVDASADLARAVDIVENAKVQRPSVCNALDTLLVHRSVAEAFLPQVAARLSQSRVELRATEEACRILEADPGHGARVLPAGPDNFDTEWMALVLGIKIVADLDEAIAHIQAHSTEHSDSILTQDLAHAERFVNEVNSAAVYVNASTRFTDGGQFGLGAEVAVSTQKLHARGPMGLEELTTYKWIGWGQGQIRA